MAGDSNHTKAGYNRAYGSKGFGFVEMKSDAEAQAAIQALNSHEVGGRALTVNEARPKTEGGDGFRGGRRDGGGGRGGYGGRRY